jgi:hypothetical protein
MRPREQTIAPAASILMDVFVTSRGEPRALLRRRAARPGRTFWNGRQNAFPQRLGEILNATEVPFAQSGPIKGNPGRDSSFDGLSDLPANLKIALCDDRAEWRDAVDDLGADQRAQAM